MKIELSMPRLSDSMTEGTVTAWFKNEGDAVAKGEAIAEIETEKSTVDLESPASGVLARIVVVAGSGATPVGGLLAEIETDTAASVGEAGVKRASDAGAARESAAEAALEKTASAKTANVASPVAARRIEPHRTASPAAEKQSHAEEADVVEEAIEATPLARRMAAQAGLSLGALARSGIGGKVCKADVEAALGRGASLSIVSRAVEAASSSRPSGVWPRSTSGETIDSPASAEAAARGAVTPLSRVRRTIAERMTRSMATIPHFYLAVECRADRLLEVRRKLAADGLSVSINDFIVRAAAMALARVPEANASWVEGEGVLVHERIDIAVAVALDEGLVTPVVRAPDALGLAGIASAVRELVARAREGKLAPHEYDGATFTISNLGMYGVGEMFAIINPPQACILGVGAAEPKPVVEDGAVVAGTVMTLSLSADHRVIDGATGAKLLAEIRRLLEEPVRMLA